MAWSDYRDAYVEMPFGSDDYSPSVIACSIKAHHLPGWSHTCPHHQDGPPPLAVRTGRLTLHVIVQIYKEALC